jgi:regulator of nucleoside diphosphate kinase
MVPARGDVPILGPIGAALIGMERNASIEWLDDGRLRTLTVLDYGW